MRHALWALALLVPFAPTVDAPDAPQPLLPVALEAASLPSRCAPPAIEARVAEEYVALRWAPSCDASAYLVLRGRSEAELAPLVEVAHPGHVDVGVAAGATYAYALRIGDAVGPSTLATLPPG